MLSDSPPERDVEWTERGVQGAWRFMQRLWRLGRRSGRDREDSPVRARPVNSRPTAVALRKATHQALARVTDDIEKLHFNVCVAHIYEFANRISTIIGEIEGAASDLGPDFRWAMREAVNVLVQLFHPMMPHLAEECWAMLGHDTLVAEAAWPQVERDLLDRAHADAAGADQRQKARRRDGGARCRERRNRGCRSRARGGTKGA